MRAIVLLLLCAASASIAPAQEFRVYTTVRDLEADGEPIVSRSLTLFRGTRSYDWLDDLGEVIISDRNRGCSSVVTRQLDGTKIERDQLAHFLKVGRAEAEDYLATLPDAAARQSVGFTLDPDFQTAYESKLNRLSLSGGGWMYTIETATPPDPALATAYLDYADRAAAMNFLFHPRSTFPAMRQAVNAELRTVGRLPTTVTLTGPPSSGVRLRAEHKYGWQLESFDHRRIGEWDALLAPESDRVRWMTLQSFQQSTIAVQ